MRNPSSSSSTTAAAAATSKTPCCSKVGLKRGPWTPEEDELLANYIKKEGEGKWRTLPKRAGLLRCGKSCRLRWMNYLRPCVKRGQIAPDEEDLILRLHRLLGNRWSLIAGRIPGRTDNEIKNYWNTHLSKKLIGQGIDPRTHKPLVHTTTTVTNTTPVSATDNNKNHVYHHMSDKHFSSPYVIPPPTTPPSTTQNNPSPSYYIAPSQESYSGGGGGGAAAAVSPSASGNGTNATGAHSSLAAHQSAVMISKSTGGYLLASCNPNNYNNVHEQQDQQYPIISATAAASMHVEHNVDTIQMDFTTTNSKKIINGRLSPSDEKEEEDGDHDDNNYCTDDVFSSFLNSLINDDMFNNSHNQTQQQQPDHHDKNGTSNSLSSTSALVYANLSFAAAGWDAPPIMSAPPPAFNHNNHNHNQDPKSL